MTPISFCKTGCGDIGKVADWEEGILRDCGEPIGKLKCDHGHETDMTAHCDRQVCPVCQDRWMQSLLDECQMRMSWMSSHMFDAQAYHIMISFDEPKNLEEFKNDRSDAIKWCKRLGLRGGNIVPHGRRTDDDQHLHLHVFGLGTFAVPDKYVRAETDPRVKGDKRTAIWRYERNPDTGLDQIVIIADYGRVVIKLLSMRSPTEGFDLEEYELDHAVQITHRVEIAGHDSQGSWTEVKTRTLHTVSWWGCFNSRYVERTETSEATVATCKKRTDYGINKCECPLHFCGAEVHEQRTVWIQGTEQVNPPHLTYTKTVAFSWRRPPPWIVGQELMEWKKKHQSDATAATTVSYKDTWTWPA